MLSLACSADTPWSIIDITSAFLNADIHEDDTVLVTPPPILVKMDTVKPNTAWHVKKAIYGLREAPRLWRKERDQKRTSSIYLQLLDVYMWIALRTRPDIAWATSRAARLITHAPDTCFICVKHICQYLHHTLGYALRYVPTPPQSKHKLWVFGRCLLCSNRGEESTRTGCVPWYHLESQKVVTLFNGDRVDKTSLQSPLVKQNWCLKWSSPTKWQHCHGGGWDDDQNPVRLKSRVTMQHLYQTDPEWFRDSVANTTHQCQSNLDASNGPRRYQVHLPANLRNCSRQSDKRPWSQQTTANSRRPLSHRRLVCHGLARSGCIQFHSVSASPSCQTIFNVSLAHIESQFEWICQNCA